MTTPVLIRLLGGFRLSVAGREVTSLPRKAQALLGYLAMQDGRPVTRETVSDLLWTDRGAEQARHSLRQTLLVLRRALRDAGGDVIANSPSTLAFVPGMVETDVGRFRLLARSADRAALAEASELYAGSLLDRFPPVGGDFDDWLIVARSEVADVAIDSLRRLTDACLASGDLHPAVLSAERMLGLDLLREDSHRLMMEVYLRTGRRADAIRQYDACVEVLRRELDVGPSEETEAVVRGIRRGNDLIRVGGTPEILRPDYPIFAAPSDGPPWIAVLPFRSLGIDGVPHYFAAGLVDDIVALLATLREPIVVSSQVMGIYQTDRPDVRTLARNLGVHYVVSGSVRQQAPWMRLFVELSETSSGAVLWAQTYDIDDGMLFETQDRIARQCVNTLIPHVHESELRRIRRKHPENMTAYDLVLRARALMFTLEHTAFEEAGMLIRQALRLDPVSSLAHALLADWYVLRIGQGWSDNPIADTGASADSARAAVSQDGMNVRALSLQAHTKSFLQRDYDGAIQLLDKAIEVAPNDASGWMWGASTRAYVGDGSGSVLNAERALRLSPQDPFAFRFYSSLCLAHYTAGSYDEAVHWGELGVQASPTYTSNIRFTIASMVGAGQTRKASEMAGRLIRLQPDFRVGPMRDWHPYRDRDRRDRIADHLVRAGVPE